ncbi:MAG: UMP kinase [Haloarculaceae archaeon]
MRVVVSVGGSVLVPDLDSSRVAGYAAAVERLLDAGHEVCVVVGGGETAREYIGAARELGANETELDHLGIAVTRLNARLLIAALDERAVSAPATAHGEARTALRRGEVPVMGGTAAGHTTDAVATALAEYVDADLLVYATSVPGVFDADPEADPEATKYGQIGVDDLVTLVAEMDIEAGSNAPVDLLATKLLQRAGLRAVVLDGSDPEAVVAAVEGDHDGTDIEPR